ncbi:GNAT family N-acetyltransferase [Sphingobacterium suaedae]|uniref:GNAT family N-acetyltransferase n=1 Tax=Sphingobacterium suaedae TaxID=1686402 RepID=A0ABW5KGW2_9SPHI
MEFSVLSNEMLSLHPLRPDDYDALFQVASDQAIWAQHPDFNRYQPEGFTLYFTKLLQTDMPYLVIDEADQSIIGATSFYQFDKERKRVAIGFTFLATAYWGGGFNRSLKTLMIDYALQFVDTVVFHVREKNFRSQAALAKIGAKKVAEYPAPADPTTLQFEYTIEKANWPHPVSS